MNAKLSNVRVRTLIAFGVLLSVAGCGPSRTGTPPAPPCVTITVHREGAAAETMESEVAVLLEEALFGLEGLETRAAESREGVSVVRAIFRPQRNLDLAMQDVQNAVAAARRHLPGDVDPPLLTKENPFQVPVVWLALSGEQHTLQQLSELAEKELRPQLTTIPGIGGVALGGVRKPCLRLQVSPDRLQAFGLSPLDVVRAIEEQTVAAPAGRIKIDRGETMSPEELGKLAVRKREGQPIYLRDIGVVEEGIAEPSSTARFNRMPGLAFGIRPALGSDPAQVIAAVKKELPRLRKTLPPGTELAVAIDHSPPASAGAARGPILDIDLWFPPAPRREALDEALRRLEQRLHELSDSRSGKPIVAGILTQIIPSSGEPAAEIRLVVQLNAGSDPAANVRDLRKLLADVPNMRSRVLDLTAHGFPPQRRFPVEMLLRGPGRLQLQAWSDLLRKRMEASETFTDVFSDAPTPIPTTRLVIDREKAAQVGVTVQQIVELIRVSSGDNRIAVGGSRAIEIRFHATDRAEASPQGLEIEAPGGQRVRLAMLIRRTEEQSLPVLRRFNQMPCVSLTANPADGVHLEKARPHALALAEQARKELALSDSYRVESYRHTKQP